MAGNPEHKSLPVFLRSSLKSDIIRRERTLVTRPLNTFVKIDLQVLRGMSATLL